MHAKMAFLIIDNERVAMINDNVKRYDGEPFEPYIYLVFDLK